MKTAAYETLFKLEEKYWWFVGQRFLTEKFLKKHYQPNQRILDVGCGTGINLKMFSKYGLAEGLDISGEAVLFCKKRGLKIKQGNVLKLPYNNDTFDVVAALGVFYHQAVTDDLEAMKELYRVLKPGGRAYLLDPAMNCLWGKHDEFFQTGRRYTKKDLRIKLRGAGFKIEFLSYINSFVFPLVFLNRKLEKLSNSLPSSEVEEIPSLLNKLLKWSYLFELKNLNSFKLPFGVNIYTVARK